MNEAECIQFAYEQSSGAPVEVQVLMALALVARVVTALTPTQIQATTRWGRVLNKLLRFTNTWLAWNVGKARNADDPISQKEKS